MEKPFLTITIYIQCNDDKSTYEVEKLSVNTFDTLKDAENYCRSINDLELPDNLQIRAKIINENVTYPIDDLLKIHFETIVKLEDLDVQKVLRQVDSHDLVMALKSASKDVQKKVFKNMSKRAALILKEDMDYMGPVRLKDVKESREKIVNIMLRLEDCGEIIINQYDL